MMNLITAKKVKPIIIVLIILIVATMLISGSIVTAIVLHQNSVHKLSEKMRDEGPWNPEPSIWASKDNDAFLICDNQNADRICTITAFFRIGDKWAAFTMNQRNGRKELVFESEVAEFSEPVFPVLMTLRTTHSLSGGLKKWKMMLCFPMLLPLL